MLALPRDVGLRAGAAVVMGFAVAGMHYSGMAAAQFDPLAMCSSSNLLADKTGESVDGPDDGGTLYVHGSVAARWRTISSSTCGLTQ